MQTPQQKREADARATAARRHQEEQVRRVRGQVDVVEEENARLRREIGQLRADINALNGQIGQLNGKMNALDARQKKEMAALINQVEALLKKSAGSQRRPSGSSSRPSGPGREHVVEPGHTLSAIAQAYGTTVKAIKDANNLKSDGIRVGQKLFIPQ